MPEQSSQEKTEDATPRRLREARKKGQVPKSRDVTTVFVMIVVFIVFSSLSAQIPTVTDSLFFIF
jgi:flagellar biosynthetic protein FlhB